jgi:hypothetical protein
MQFERAETARPAAAAAACAGCRNPLAGSYYTMQAARICVSCHDALRKGLASGSPARRFLKAVLFGTLASIVGAVLYVGVAALFKAEIGLVAIAVGLIVGLAVKKGSEGRGGWPYQALAMFLTYASIIVLYMPSAMERQIDKVKQEKAVAAEKAKESGQPAPAQEPAKRITNPLLWVLILIFVFIISCIEPFRHGPQNFIGLLLIGIALYEAWKINRGVKVVFQGPFQIGSASPEKSAGG